MTLDQTVDVEQAAKRPVEELSARSILAYSLGSPPRYRYPNYSI